MCVSGGVALGFVSGCRFMGWVLAMGWGFFEGCYNIDGLEYMVVFGVCLGFRWALMYLGLICMGFIVWGFVSAGWVHVLYIGL